MSRTDVNSLMNTENPGNQNLQINEALNRFVEFVDYDHAILSGDVVSIFANDYTMNPTNKIKILWRLKSGETWSGVRLDQSQSLLSIDRTLTGIGNPGGQIDGLTNTVSSDYLVWAFYNRKIEVPFVGLGFTKRVLEMPYTSITAVVGVAGNKGSVTQFNLSGAGDNRGFRFPVGAQVQITRTISATLTDFNFGIVTARTNNSVTVLLNNLAFSSNLGAGSGFITQTKNFRPLDATTGLVPNDYDYAYIGHFQTNSAGAIHTWRRRGDDYKYPHTSQYKIIYNVNSAVNVSGGLQVGKYIPRHVTEGFFHLYIERTAIGAPTIYGVLSIDKVAIASFISIVSTGKSDAANHFKIATGHCPLDRQLGQIYYYFNVVGGGNCLAQIHTFGWKKETEF